MMTIGEFKAFLEGMGVKGAPSPEQWARIAEKVAELTDVPPVCLKTPEILGPSGTGYPPNIYPYVTCVNNAP